MSPVIVAGFLVTTGVVEVINFLNRSRTIKEKELPLVLQSFDFSTLYTKIDLSDLKSRMKLLIHKTFNRMYKTNRFSFLLVQKTALDFNFLWLKSKEETKSMENLHSFMVADAQTLVRWLDFLVDNLYLTLGL